MKNLYKQCNFGKLKVKEFKYLGTENRTIQKPRELLKKNYIIELLLLNLNIITSYSNGLEAILMNVQQLLAGITPRETALL